MALWGKIDDANNAPKYLNSEDKLNTYFVDTTEALVTENREKGLKTPGWNLYQTYTDSNGNTRHRVEPLVVMKVSQGDATDIGAKDPITAGTFEVGIQYTIITAGTTDFTLIGAADSVPGTIFTATGVGTGTGTARFYESQIVPNA